MYNAFIASWQIKIQVLRSVLLKRSGKVHVLEKQPQIGRPVEDMDEPFREWQIDFGDSGYVVRYRVATSAVTILAVRHQKEAGD